MCSREPTIQGRETGAWEQTLNLPISATNATARGTHHNFCESAPASGARARLSPHPLVAMSTTLPLFWHLSSASKKERIDASVKLVSALEHFQAQFTPKSEPASEEEDEVSGTKSDGLNALNAQDVSYSIRRLVRGLASPRESSRLGFAVALTEVCLKL